MGAEGRWGKVKNDDYDHMIQRRADVMTTIKLKFSVFATISAELQKSRSQKHREPRIRLPSSS